ncbi:DUF4145 domain-containing protein [Paraburkholderia sp. RL17-373-BIF-A]|uniref:DUF4145 domain-containing protein n=1 Tax=Paraburkholderia sp. RL17-373-BIF-A TaxID=3031629 RepID=UPI0038BB297D
MQKYYPPQYQAREFNCVHCGVYAGQHWSDVNVFNRASKYETAKGLGACMCTHCHRWSYWHEGNLVIPSRVAAVQAHEDFPEGSRADYEEAREIVGRSPKAAAALLRLCLQKLMRELGEKGNNINDDIKSLVQKGVPEFVQQALDFCRVVGNNAVHPGEILLDDTPDVAIALFEMLNVIVEQRIAMPKRIQAQYAELPESARRAIEARDTKANPA